MCSDKTLRGVRHVWVGVIMRPIRRYGRGSLSAWRIKLSRCHQRCERRFVLVYGVEIAVFIRSRVQQSRCGMQWLAKFQFSGPTRRWELELIGPCMKSVLYCIYLYGLKKHRQGLQWKVAAMVWQRGEERFVVAFAEAASNETCTFGWS